MPTIQLSVGLRRVVVAACCGWLAGCASEVTVESSFPTPLVDPLPVRMGVIFDEALNNYVHSEEIPRQASYTIELGAANISMLAPLFDTMFTATRRVDGVPLDAGGDLDGVIKPELEKFEFDVPLGERDEFVEVWMQYRLSLYEPDGELVTDWPVSGYGRSEFSGNRTDALHRAAVVAMREVGATISTEFATQPAVSYWLEETQNERALSVGNSLGD